MNHRCPFLLLTLLALVFSAPGIARADDQSAVMLSQAKAETGKPFPDLRATALDHQDVDTSKISGPFVVSFFATWCGPCRMELPELEKVVDKFGTKVTVIGISLDAAEHVDAVNDLIKEDNLTFPVIHDTTMLFGKHFGIEAIPTLIYVGADHVVKGIGVGLGDPAVEAFWTDYPVKETPAPVPPVAPTPEATPAGSGSPVTLDAGTVDIGKPFVDFSVDATDHTRIDTRDIKGPFVVSFFPTWCGPCNREMPELQQVLDQHPGKLTVIGISLDEQIGPAKLVQWMITNGIKFPIALVGNGELSDRYMVTGIPLSVYVGADHKIIDIQEGYDPSHSTPFWKDFPLKEEAK